MLMTYLRIKIRCCHWVVALWFYCCLENKACYKFSLFTVNIPLQVSVTLLSINLSPSLGFLSCILNCFPLPIITGPWGKHRSRTFLLHTQAKIRALSAIQIHIYYLLTAVQRLILQWVVGSSSQDKFSFHSKLRLHHFHHILLILWNIQGYFKSYKIKVCHRLILQLLTLLVLVFTTSVEIYLVYWAGWSVEVVQNVLWCLPCSVDSHICFGCEIQSPQQRK